MTTLAQHTCTSPSLTATRGQSVRAIFSRAFGLWRSRRALAGLTPTQLEDVGISPRDAHIEACRPVWDVPHNWRD